MKTIYLALTALALTITAAQADSAIPTRLALAPLPVSVTAPVHANNAIAAVPALTIAPLPGTTPADAKLTLGGSTSSFAQFNSTSKGLPISSGMVLFLIALFVLALRAMGVNQAHAMAEHERDSYTGKARMFHSLHEQRSSHSRVS